MSSQFSSPSFLLAIVSIKIFPIIWLQVAVNLTPIFVNKARRTKHSHRFFDFEACTLRYRPAPSIRKRNNSNNQIELMKASPLRTTTKVIALFTHSLLNRSSPLITSTTTAFRPSLLTTDTSTSLATSSSSSSANNYYCSATNSTIVNQPVAVTSNATDLEQSNNSTNISINRNMSAVQSMQRGHNGRIEEAFAQAKERGEAAFVTFCTAGFPEKDGE